MGSSDEFQDVKDINLSGLNESKQSNRGDPGVMFTLIDDKTLALTKF